jgi:hypothetical protein
MPSSFVPLPVGRPQPVGPSSAGFLPAERPPQRVARSPTTDNFRKSSSRPDVDAPPSKAVAPAMPCTLREFECRYQRRPFGYILRMEASGRTQDIRESINRLRSGVSSTPVTSNISPRDSTHT